MTIKLWEPKRKCPKAVPTHLQNHVVWSRTLKCSVKSYVTGPSTKCYFNEILFMRVLTLDKVVLINGCEVFRVPWSLGFFARPTSKRWCLKTIQMTITLYSLIWDFRLSQINIWTTTTWCRPKLYRQQSQWSADIRSLDRAFDSNFINKHTLGRALQTNFTKKSYKVMSIDNIFNKGQILRPKKHRVLNGYLLKNAI